MNYVKLHNDIIKRALDRDLAEYSEIHHIKPRCIGGSDEEENLVALTPKEHFIVHKLLTKIHKDNPKILFAFVMMTRSSKFNKRFYASNYDKVKKENSIALSLLHKGKPKSKEHRQKISESNKGRVFSKESKEKMSLWQKGKKRTYPIGRKRKVQHKKRVFKIKRKINPQHRKSLIEGQRDSFLPTMNTKGYEILTPTGFQHFDGIKRSGLVPSLEFILDCGKIINVSKSHMFSNSKQAKEYLVGETLDTVTGSSSIVSITDIGKKEVFEPLEVKGGHLYYANGIVHHNCMLNVDHDFMVIPEFTAEIEADCVKEYTRPKRFDAYVSMDLGVKDMTAIVWAYYDYLNNKLIIEEEFSVSGSKVTVAHLARNIRDIERKLYEDPITKTQREPFKRIADNNEAIARQDLSTNYDIMFLPTRKDDKDAALHDLRDRIYRRQIIISPNCKQVLFHLKNATWNSRKTGFDRSPEGGHFDFIDALIYLVRNIDWHKNPYPRDWGITQGDYFNRDERTQVSEKYEVFSDMFKKKK